MRERPRVAFVFTHRIQYFTNLLDDLAARGRVRVLAVEGGETCEIADPGFDRTIAWDNRRAARYDAVVLSSAGLALGEALRKFDPDVVHLNGYAARIQRAAFRWATSRGVRYVIRGDGDCLRPEPAWRTEVRRRLLRPLVGGAETVFHQGEENRRYWERRGASDEQLVWIPCVADAEIFRRPAFASADDRRIFRAGLGVSPEDVVFVVSGKLESRKRPADALGAFAALIRTGGHRARLWFLGSGPLEPALRRTAARLGVADRVRFLGFRNQTGIPPVLQGADVLVHPSEADPWPYSVLEAAVSGLPLLLSDRTGSAADWALPPRACLTFRCGDPGDLRDRLAELMAPAARASLGEGARVKAERHHESVFCEIFEDRIERRGRGSAEGGARSACARGTGS